MWTTEQRQRMYLEHVTLQNEGFSQFCVYHNKVADTYEASGVATSNTGYRYQIEVPLPSGFPYTRPPMYITNPNPLLGADGSPVSALGVSHQMHTLTPKANGAVQICHWRDNRWHSGIMLHKVFLKAHIWIEAYEQHISTGRPLAEFVRTMAETL